MARTYLCWVTPKMKMAGELLASISRVDLAHAWRFYYVSNYSKKQNKTVVHHFLVDIIGILNQNTTVWEETTNVAHIA